MSCKFLAGFFTLTIVHVKGGYISEIIFILVPFQKSTKSLSVNFLIYLFRKDDKHWTVVLWSFFYDETKMKIPSEI